MADVKHLWERLARVAERSGRRLEEIRPVAVAAGSTVEEVGGGGMDDFGAMSVDDLVAHAAVTAPDVRWHFVGPLHPKQARQVRSTVTLLHTLDDPHLLDAWIKGPGAAPPVLVQVAPTVGAAGVHADAVGDLVGYARRAGVRVRGLAIAEPAPDGATARRWFSELRHLRDRLEDTPGELPELSMGTSDDWEIAVEEGSTLIRLRTTIFGTRR